MKSEGQINVYLTKCLIFLVGPVGFEPTTNRL
jgi:hypothetical protein